jgi:hypothetical protein
VEFQPEFIVHVLWLSIYGVIHVIAAGDQCEMYTYIVCTCTVPSVTKKLYASTPVVRKFVIGEIILQ